jgi:hypothetical protein
MAKIDPTTDRAAAAVLAAFEAAQRDNLPPVDCYLAGVEAWHRAHPSQTAAHAGKQAVAIILAAKVRLSGNDI